MARDAGADQNGDQTFRDLRGTNQSAMRARNERIVLSLLRERGAMAKAEIARQSGLSPQTVSVIMRALEQDGLLQRGDPVRGKVGQPSVPMNLDPTGAYFLGLKVGRRSADLVLVDFLGKKIGDARLMYHFPTPDDIIDFARENTARLSTLLPGDGQDRIAGLGIAIPGYFWEWSGTVGEAPAIMEAWRHRDVAEELGEHFDFPVFSQNDASSACRAELLFGTERFGSDYLYVFVGYFVGGGLVLGNELFAGQTGNAGALGPILVPDPAGGTRQLVDVASLADLERRITADGGNGAMIWQSPENWSFPPHHLKAWTDHAARALAYAISAACGVIDFQHVVIDGWLPDAARKALVSRTSEHLTALNTVGLILPEIREGTIGRDARALGAAGLPLSRRFMIGSEDPSPA